MSDAFLQLLIVAVVAVVGIQAWANYANNVLFVTRKPVFRQRDEPVEEPTRIHRVHER